MSAHHRHLLRRFKRQLAARGLAVGVHLTRDPAWMGGRWVCLVRRGDGRGPLIAVGEHARRVTAIRNAFGGITP